MRFDVITIFPRLFDSFLNESMVKRALKKGVIRIKVRDLRDYTTDKHRTVDDRPYGGGPGMILKAEPFFKALKDIKKTRARKRRVIMLDPAGKQFDQKAARRLSKYDQLVLLCGRYEGFDARVRKLVDERVSIGPYVLSGGELAAMVMMEAIGRLRPGFIGHPQALEKETEVLEGYVEYPQYTRPEVFKAGPGKSWTVPPVLLSGNHQKIKRWRDQQAAKAK